MYVRVWKLKDAFDKKGSRHSGGCLTEQFRNFPLAGLAFYAKDKTWFFKFENENREIIQLHLRNPVVTVTIECWLAGNTHFIFPGQSDYARFFLP